VFFGNFNILFLKIILGIIFLLFIPGYNLVNILFPEFSIRIRLGLCSVFSLGLEVLIMLIYYIVGVSFTNSNPFFFDINILVILFSILSILLILIYFFKYSNYGKISMNTNICTKRVYFKFKNNKFYIILTFIFIIDLILLCFNVYLNRVSLTRGEILEQYTENFTFFYHTDIFFYVFYAISIIILIILAFKSENKFIFLSLVCIFLYVQLIIPYLQIGDLFSADAIFLENSLYSYNNYGIFPVEITGLTINLNNKLVGLRYATSTFYAILLINFTGMDLLFSLSFLYPLSICFTPFFIYVFFKRYFNKANISEKSIGLLTLLTIFNPLFLKFGHTPTTVVIGFIIFSVLIFFLFDIFKNQVLSNKMLIVIIFLYLFLTYTHTEEALFFLAILFVVQLYFILFKQDNINPSLFFSKRIKDNVFFKKFALLFGILLLIFYLSQEFLGYFPSYILFFKYFPFFNSIFEFYIDSRIIPFPFVGTSYVPVSLFILILITLIPILLYFIYFLASFVKSKNINIGGKIDSIIDKINSYFIRTKYKILFQLIFIVFIFVSIFYLNFFVVSFISSEEPWLIFLEIFIVYFYFIIYLHIFFTNLLYYKLNHINERYFLIIIFTITLSFTLFALSSADIIFIYYNLQKTLYIIFFLNMFLIEENYLKDLQKNKYKYFILILSVTIFSGLFISFRKLKFG